MRRLVFFFCILVGFRRCYCVAQQLFELLSRREQLDDNVLEQWQIILFAIIFFCILDNGPVPLEHDLHSVKIFALVLRKYYVGLQLLFLLLEDARLFVLLLNHALQNRFISAGIYVTKYLVVDFRGLGYKYIAEA